MKFPHGKNPCWNVQINSLQFIQPAIFMMSRVRENELISVQDFAFEESDTEAQVFSMHPISEWV